MRRNLDQNNSPGSDLGAFPNFDVAQNRSPRTDENTVANLWMTVAPLLPCASQSNVVQDGNVVADARRLADDDPGAVVKENPFSYFGRGMDVHGEHLAGPALNR